MTCELRAKDRINFQNILRVCWNGAGSREPKLRMKRNCFVTNGEVVEKMGREKCESEGVVEQ